MKYKSEFSRLLNSTIRKELECAKRSSRYDRRNFIYGVYGSKVCMNQPQFCVKCLTETCYNKEHDIFRVTLNPRLRIPRKTASKTRWKEFAVEFKRFHKLKLNI